MSIKLAKEILLDLYRSNFANEFLDDAKYD